MEHERFMRRCLELARKGIYTTPPNPMVGSVIVCQGKIIGEGYHVKPGQPHAEINAINSVKDPSLLRKATLYVNLEPCSHYGKTPPCAEKIAKLGIPRVVIGIKDFSSKVNGKGIAIMQRAGVKVIAGVLEREAFELNRRFFVNQLLGRPYVVLKWAQSADGYLDYADKKQRTVHWITDEFSRTKVHFQRATEQAVLVGAETVRKDNPSLTIRSWYAPKQPVRIVIAGRFDKLLLASRVFTDDQKTLFVNTGNGPVPDAGEKKIFINAPNKSIKEILSVLYHSYDIYSVVVEGGRKTLDAFIAEGMWDEAYVYTGPVRFGVGVEAPILRGIIVRTEVADGIETRIYKNPVYENFVGRF